jgi:hypothetical protein
LRSVGSRIGLFNQNMALSDNFWRLIIFGLICSAIFFSGFLNRPLWFDEFLYFSLCASNSVTELSDLFQKSLEGINHSQTGAYVFLDYFLVRFFGLEFFVLRFPSIFSAFLLFFASVSLVKIRGYSHLWQVLVIMAMYGQTSLMYFVFEARPYMPLVGATAGTLAFYIFPANQKKSLSFLMFGLFSIMFGSIMHPYFALYWVAIYLFCIWLHITEGVIRADLSEVVKHLNLPIAFLGFLAYCLTVYYSWGTHSPRLDLDPYQFVPRSDFISVFESFHFEFFSNTNAMIIYIFVVLLILIFLYVAKSSVRPHSLFAPIILLIIALILSIALTYISYKKGYWIISRQWVASSAIVVIAFVWFSAELSSQLSKVSNLASRLFFLFTILLVGVGIYSQQSKQVAERFQHVFDGFEYDSGTTNKSTQCKTKDFNCWVTLANLNIKEGKQIWPIFKIFYEQQNACMLENPKQTFLCYLPEDLILR